MTVWIVSEESIITKFFKIFYTWDPLFKCYIKTIRQSKGQNSTTQIRIGDISRPMGGTDIHLIKWRLYINLINIVKILWVILQSIGKIIVSPGNWYLEKNWTTSKTEIKWTALEDINIWV
jgi:hypothetical protein